MQVILLERIARLGNLGQTVDVKPGYARNFLLPQGKALPATAANMAKFEAQRKELEAKNESARQAAATASEAVKGQTVTIERQASETGQLFGSVKASDIADKLENVERSMVMIGEPIKALGEYEVRVALHPEVVVKVTVNVTRNAA